MSVDDLRAKAVDVWEKVPNAGTFRAVRLSDAVAVVERAEWRVRDLEAALREVADNYEDWTHIGGVARGALAGSPEPLKWTGSEVLRSGRPVTEHEEE